MTSAPAGAPTIIEFTLPFPPEELHPNSSVHRMVKAKAAKAYKRDCWLLACSERNRLSSNQIGGGAVYSFPLKAPVMLSLTFVVRNMRRDPDNLVASAKHAIDALVSAGLLRDDNAKVLTLAPASVVSGTRQEVRVRLEGAQ